MSKLSAARMATLALGLLLAIALVALTPLSAQESSKAQVFEDHPQKGSGEDKNVKEKSDKNAPSALQAAPNKSGKKTRGSGPYACTVHFDNRTALVVQIYLDGNFRGLVGPGGDLYLVTGNGTTTGYARADYTDGTYSSWGPRTFGCGAAYTWLIYP